jgi:hypothetical protein
VPQGIFKAYFRNNQRQGIIPNGNRFSVLYGYGFGTGCIFLLSGAYQQYETEEKNKRCPNMWLEKPGNRFPLDITGTQG